MGHVALWATSADTEAIDGNSEVAGSGAFAHCDKRKLLAEIRTLPLNKMVVSSSRNYKTHIYLKAWEPKF